MRAGLHQSGLPFDVRETRRLRARIDRLPLNAILCPPLREQESERRRHAQVADWKRSRAQTPQARRESRRKRVRAIVR